MSDSAPGTGNDRFTQHPQALQELQMQLQASRAPRERAALVGRLLSIVGDLGRRQNALPTQGVENALKSLTGEDLEAWLASTDLSKVKSELNRATESAFEASLADNAAERAEYAAWALEALSLRDGVESSLTALERWEALGNSLGGEGKRARERLMAELATLDGQKPAAIRRLIAVNRERRAELSRLDADQRERAWWYSARAECDGLVELFQNGSMSVKAASHCLDCRRDAERAKLAEAPPEAHVTADELWELDLGQLPASRRRWIEKHARGCVECGMALRALVDEDESFRPAAQPEPMVAPSSREAAPELVEARSEFKVLLFRDPRRARLVVEPMKSFRIAAARIDAPWAGSPSPIRAGSGGVEFELGPSKALRGQRVSLTVDLVGGAQLDLEIEL
jgi:hypothetical protein